MAASGSQKLKELAQAMEKQVHAMTALINGGGPLTLECGTSPLCLAGS